MLTARVDLTKTSTSIFIVTAACAAGAVVAWFAGARGLTLGGLPVVVVAAALSFAIQWLAFIPAALRQTEHFYDLVGSLTYLTVIGVAVGARAEAGLLDARSVVVAALVVVWAVRLGSFLFGRVRRAGSDARFELIKRSWHRFLVAWTLQGLWVFLTLLAALVMLAAPDVRPLGVFDAVGLAVWCAGFAMEVVADRQKRAFRADPANRDRWIDAGLWAWSRHPNYAGEILLWKGVWIAALGALDASAALAVLSPLFVFVLLRFGSGVPILEERADKRWGGQPAYESYKARTPLLWPRPLWPRPPRAPSA